MSHKTLLQILKCFIFSDHSLYSFFFFSSLSLYNINVARKVFFFFFFNQKQVCFLTLLPIICMHKCVYKYKCGSHKTKHGPQVCFPVCSLSTTLYLASQSNMYLWRYRHFWEITKISFLAYAKMMLFQGCHLCSCFLSGQEVQ